MAEEEQSEEQIEQPVEKSVQESENRYGFFMIMKREMGSSFEYEWAKKMLVNIAIFILS